MKNQTARTITIGHHSNAQYATADITLEINAKQIILGQTAQGNQKTIRVRTERA
jgi:hypothetical protein